MNNATPTTTYAAITGTDIPVDETTIQDFISALQGSYLWPDDIAYDRACAEVARPERPAARPACLVRRHRRCRQDYTFARQHHLRRSMHRSMHGIVGLVPAYRVEHASPSG